MNIPRHAPIPSLVRVKPGALDRIGIYAERSGFRSILVLHSDGMPAHLLARLDASAGARILRRRPVTSTEIDFAERTFPPAAANADAVIGFGGGKALDVAKYVASLAQLPCIAVPTSLSNDGFCSPQSSLTVSGRRRSVPAAMPVGVVVDTGVCMDAPVELWRSGVGDLASKLTAVADWKLAFHATGEPVDDFAALLSDASVHQFLARPARDLEGLKLLGTSLLLNGISMAVCGSSRPASGSEHLISHALDAISARPRLHGLQVGVAAYLVSLLQAANSETITRLLDATGFWETILADPFDRAEWLTAVRAAPEVKPGYFTILSTRDCAPEIARAIDSDARLRGCFV